MRKRSLRRRHRIASHICAEKRKKILSPAGNRTPVFRVTGGDSHHYTTAPLDNLGTHHIYLRIGIGVGVGISYP